MYKINERKKATRDRFRQQAWDYFAIHASQRLTTFNFYLVIATLLTTGILASFQKQYEIRFAGIVLGLLLLIFSFVFWKLDQRNKHLIRHAEKALHSRISLTIWKYRMRQDSSLLRKRRRE
ncbi:MAG TPA: hypothetical protein VEV84_13385 [Pyrinomonadaceae bacterium]|nr:hypothetical protein [Pyrinomonadaceae bacterium]